MYKTIIFSLLALSVLGSSYHERFDWTFEEYQVEFGKKYGSQEETVIRQAIFEDNMNFIKKQNSNSNTLWKAGVNQFSDMFEEEKKAFYKGVDKAHIRSFSSMLKAERFLELEDYTTYPENPACKDWRDAKVITEVKNQGQCGSCWAFATTETVESYGAIASGKLLTLSPQQLVDCAKNTAHCGGTGGCEGSIAELALAYLARYGGQELEETYPYTAVDGTCHFNKSEAQISVKGFQQLPGNDEQAFEDALANVGPLAVNVDATYWGSYSSGIFDSTDYDKNIDINHVVQAVGYGHEDGKKYWIVRNSWADTWGEKGYIRLLREENKTCGIDSTPLDGIRCEGYKLNDTVCGQSGILYDPVYAVGAAYIG